MGNSWCGRTKKEKESDNLLSPLLEQKKEKTEKKNPEEENYLKVMQTIVKEGDVINDRTGVGTHSKINQHFLFSLEDHQFPLLTTKKVHLKSVFNELQWFLNGETDAAVLSARGTHIWDQNSDRKTLDKLGFEKRKEGDCGPIYGFQWRHFGAEYPLSKNNKNQGVDQIQQIIQQIKNDPLSRRIILSAWNPFQLRQMVLPPCHVMAQFLVRNDHLHCILTMRSGDMFLGIPFNIASYALLTILICNLTQKKPGSLSINIGDAHVYKNHLEAVAKQCQRTPKACPKLFLKTKKEGKEERKDPNEFVWTDLDLQNYDPEPLIRAPMAV